MAGNQEWDSDHDYVLVAPPPPWKPLPHKFEPLSNSIPADHLLVAARRMKEWERPAAVAKIALETPANADALFREAGYWAQNIEQKTILDYRYVSESLVKAVTSVLEKNGKLEQKRPTSLRMRLIHVQAGPFTLISRKLQLLISPILQNLQ